MAITLIQLAAALRLGDGETAPVEPVAGLLSRLLEVSQAFVAIAAPDAPEAIKDEAAVRMTATLYDAPTAASGDRYASAWRNSGAEHLVSRFVVRRAGSEGEGVPSVGPSTGGLDDDQVRAIVDSLLADHADLDNVHHTPPTGGGDVTAHNAASDSHEDIRESLEGRITQDSVEDTANRLINAAGHASNTGLTEANAAIGRNATALTTHEGTPHGGGNGGGTPAEVYAFTATLADIADVASGTAFANLTSGLTAGELVNQGSGFTVETAASRDQLVIANAGTYLVTGTLIGEVDAVSTGADRGLFRARIARERSTVVTGLAPEGTPSYARNQLGDFAHRLGSSVSGVYEFEAGDKIELQGLYEGQGTSTVQFNLSGARSGISIVIIGRWG